MKLFKKILCFGLFLFSMVLMNNRSVCFASEVQYTDNVIPAMTSNTSPSGIADAKNELDATYKYYAWRAFDHNISDISEWVSSTYNEGYITYKFADAKCITKYTINSDEKTASVKHLPKNWTFEGFNEQTGQWVILDTQTSITNWTIGEKKEFEITNTNSYKLYKINVTATVDSAYHVHIGEIEMMETVNPPAEIGNSAILRVTMVTGEIKEYNLSASELANFLTWFDNRSEGTGIAYYIFNKGSAAPYLNRKEYIVFDKISSFEIMEY